MSRPTRKDLARAARAKVDWHDPNNADRALSLTVVGLALLGDWTAIAEHVEMGFDLNDHETLSAVICRIVQTDADVGEIEAVVANLVRLGANPNHGHGLAMIEAIDAGSEDAIDALVQHGARRPDGA